MKHAILISVMLSLMSAFAAAHGAPDSYWRHQIDKRCMGSPFGLATDNIPMTNEKATTIINIWALRSSQGASVGWLYKNESKQYWFQGNWRYVATLRSALTPKLFQRLIVVPKKAVGGPSLPPARLSSTEVGPLRIALQRSGIAREGCFRGDLPSSYTASYVEPGAIKNVQIKR